MRKLFKTITLGDEVFRVTWDMTAWATMERLTGSPNAFAGFVMNATNTVAALWAAIDAAAASEDKDAPISLRRLGTLMQTPDDIKRAGDVIGELIAAFMPEPPKGKGEAPAAASPSPSLGATSSEPSTSALENATSGG